MHRGEVDRTTGLLNRAAFHAALGLAAKRRTGFAVLFCDIDFMKLVNDVLGYDVGNRVLERAGDALYSTPDVCVASRYSSDEFAGLAFCTKTDLADVAAAAWRAMTAALKPFGTETLTARGVAHAELLRGAPSDIQTGPNWGHRRFPLRVSLSSLWVSAYSPLTACEVIPALYESVLELRLRQGSGFTAIL